MHDMNQLGTRNLVDPELMQLLEILPTFQLSQQTLSETRQRFSQDIHRGPNPPVAPVRKTIDGKDGLVDVYWYDVEPSSNVRPALLHIHGGGMVLGSARDMQLGPATLALSLGVPIASVEYRLAPETPFPGPQEDCYSALVWMAESAPELGIDLQRIAVTGESAGGGLAAAVCQMARDRSGPSLLAQILVYPMLDHRVGGDADPWRNQHTGEFVWTRESNQFGWESLRGDYRPRDEKKGWFSPALADDLRGLPPTWIAVGNLDLFFDEDLDYARRLVGSGVAVELHSYPGAFHGFDVRSDTRVGKAALRDRLSGIRRLLGLMD